MHGGKISALCECSGMLFAASLVSRLLCYCFIWLSACLRDGIGFRGWPRPDDAAATGGIALLFQSPRLVPTVSGGCGIGRSPYMSSLIDAFPLLVRELSRALRDGGRASLAEQVERAVIDRVTFDESVNAGYIYVRPARDLNVVEANIVSVRHGETIEVETQYWTNIDTDNFDRLAGIEVLAPGGIKNEMMRRAND